MTDQLKLAGLNPLLFKLCIIGIAITRQQPCAAETVSYAVAVHGCVHQKHTMAETLQLYSCIELSAARACMAAANPFFEHHLFCLQAFQAVQLHTV